MNINLNFATEARYLWQDNDGVWHQSSGSTRSIGRYGVFIHADVLPPAGAPVQVVIKMTPSDSPGCEGLLMGKGVAVRVENSPAVQGFAAELLLQPEWTSWFDSASSKSPIPTPPSRGVPQNSVPPLSELPNVAVSALFRSELTNPHASQLALGA